MSAFEQRVEAPEKEWQYLLFAAEPYETIAFKIPNLEIDKEAGKFYSNWDEENKVFVLQLFFKKGGAQAPRAAPPSLMQPGMPGMMAMPMGMAMPMMAMPMMACPMPGMGAVAGMPLAPGCGMPLVAPQGTAAMPLAMCDEFHSK